MNRIILLLLLLAGFVFGQKADAYLRFQQRPALAKGESAPFRVLVKGSEGLAQELSQEGFEVQSDLGRMATVQVTRQQLSRLLSMNDVQRVTFTPPKKLYNSKAVNYENVQTAYNAGYTGKDVLVGIVDTGIDFYHPMFRKENGDTRILYIWDQTLSGSGPSGTSFTYGVEYSEAQINQDLKSGSPYSVVKQKDVEGHGTHVAGSAAGADPNASPPDTLHGGAKEANLIIVKTSLQNADIIDGINYIFTRASALGKPCVVNLSLGGQYGPHDGSDDDSQAINALTGTGKIVVYAAGNDGNKKVHYYKTNVVSSDQIQFSYTDYVNVWIEAGDDLTSASLSWDGGSISNVIKGTYKVSGNVQLSVDKASSANNNEIAVAVFIDDTTLSSKTFTLTLNSLSDKNNNGTITRHGWASDDAFLDPYGAFSQGTSYGSSDYPYTLSNDACAQDVISVGAFISRENWPASDGYTYHYTNSGKEGGIAGFSGIGPTADGRNKPDIIAGGQIVLSAKSSFISVQKELLPPAPFTDDYYYTQGTSMAAPVASGAIALLLEKHPTWNPDAVKEYLFNHAQGTSATTGGTPAEVKVKDDPNNWDRVFGYGAIDLTDAFGPDAIDHNAPPIVTRFTLAQNYPNPFGEKNQTTGNTTTIRYGLKTSGQAEIPVQLIVYNTLGQTVKKLVDRQERVGEHTVVFDAKDLPSGIYFYTLQVGGHKLTRKMILLR
ncbi:MAG TPA: T9SS type A sorting domain-containing protein [Caldithrix abyssi]|uniref:T9SS type A sorting domain-containing protein n=1 Tax=Caldithrix abyssi TaxID=187145 RepID=A0A7V5PQF4_CALAY|nr:T9SS type A sorting domain-containing protein [Caldithrix abyssi]